ncbi:MAG: hypothetical protein M1269_09875 [Chloroflexi bacterium]|nr:hypothetical protein [Chloroflexota bacterium]
MADMNIPKAGSGFQYIFSEDAQIKKTYKPAEKEIKHLMAEGDKIQMHQWDREPKDKELENMKQASQKFQEASKLSHKISNQNLYNESASKAISEQITMADPSLHLLDKKAALLELNKAMELAKLETGNYASDAAPIKNAMYELDHPVGPDCLSAPPPVGGGCGINPHHQPVPSPVHIPIDGGVVN